MHNFKVVCPYLIAAGRSQIQTSCRVVGCVSLVSKTSHNGDNSRKVSLLKNYSKEMETEKLNECKQQINVAASREALVFSKLAYKLTLAS